MSDSDKQQIWKLREVTRVDQKAVEAHLLRLDHSDRVMRFCGSVSEQNVASLLRTLDWHRSVFLGCFVDGVLRGLVHVAEIPETDRETEFAVSVERAFQRSGMATDLVQAALRLAKRRGAKAMTMVAMLENAPMKKLATKLGFDVIDRDTQLIGRLAWP
ncbi:MAG: GNAT family N-acetyltransferase [Pseudomonadota bacterium]